MLVRVSTSGGTDLGVSCCSGTVAGLLGLISGSKRSDNCHVGCGSRFKRVTYMSTNYDSGKLASEIESENRQLKQKDGASDASLL